MVPHLVQLYRDGEFPVDKLASVYSATAIDQALEDLRAGKVCTSASACVSQDNADPSTGD